MCYSCFILTYHIITCIIWWYLFSSFSLRFHDEGSILKTCFKEQMFFRAVIDQNSYLNHLYYCCWQWYVYIILVSLFCVLLQYYIVFISYNYIYSPVLFSHLLTIINIFFLVLIRIRPLNKKWYIKWYLFLVFTLKNTSI